jgi:hypothetical protein
MATRFMQVTDYENLQKPTILTGNVTRVFVKPMDVRTPRTRLQVWDPILRHVDDMYDMYTPSMKKCAKEMFIEKTKEFITSREGSQYLGPKKCRDIMSCITNNKGWGESFWWYISYILDVTVHVQSVHDKDANVLHVEWKKNATSQSIEVFV